MTIEELTTLVASIVANQNSTAERLAQYGREVEEMKKQIEKILVKLEDNTPAHCQQLGELLADQSNEEFNQQLKDLDKQMRRLGEKFGGVTEGLALPSMTRILTERFGMEVISPSVRVKKQGHNMEIDVLAYANSDVNEAYVVEVKSHARDEAITQLQKIMERFHQVFPEHKNKKAYGILAAVDLSDDLKDRILKAGFYVARIHDQVFELDVPANFKPKAY